MPPEVSRLSAFKNEMANLVKTKLICMVSDETDKFNIIYNIKWIFSK